MMLVLASFIPIRRLNKLAGLLANNVNRVQVARLALANPNPGL